MEAHLEDDMTVVLVHGVPETWRIWDGLRTAIGRESVALKLPGFGCARPFGFAATKDAYASWLGDALRGIDGRIDLVGDDWGLCWRCAWPRPSSCRCAAGPWTWPTYSTPGSCGMR